MISLISIGGLELQIRLSEKPYIHDMCDNVHM